MQHRSGLIAARNLRLASEGARPLASTVLEFLAAWRREIEPHFRAEEAVLLPEFALAAGGRDPMIGQVLREHAALLRDVRELSGPAAGQTPVGLAGQIARALEAHIRFEERILFPAIESALAGPALARLGKRLSEWEEARSNELTDVIRA